MSIPSADHITGMRLVPPLMLASMLALAVAACGAPGPWERPGISDAVAASDLGECRRGAEEEVSRTYVFSFPFPYPLGWGGAQVSYLAWQKRFEAERAYAESRLTDDCMRSRGYSRRG
jgi:hypothetical protein